MSGGTPPPCAHCQAALHRILNIQQVAEAERTARVWRQLGLGATDQHILILVARHRLALVVHTLPAGGFSAGTRTHTLAARTHTARSKEASLSSCAPPA